MTDKEYREQKRRVQKVWDRWYTPLGMNWWRIDCNWEREREEDSWHTIGKTYCNWEYRTANITFYLPACVDLNDDKLEEAIVHEFVHVLAMPIHDCRDDQAREITEHTVTTIARSLIWAREAGEREGSKKEKEEKK